MPHHPFALDAGTLALLWLAGWGGSFGLIRKGATYLTHPLVTSGVFLLFSLLAAMLFRPWLEPLVSTVAAPSVLVLVAAVVLTIAVYALAPRWLRRPDDLIARHPEEFYLPMQYRYLVPKSFEILFQQLIIVVLTLRLAATGLPLPAVVLVFLGCFALLHLPMLLLVRRRVGIAYNLASLTLAAVFPLLILRVPSGVVYSYAAHWFFYTMAALTAWIYAGGSRARFLPK
ncbi:MAG TPA: hypothetical protein PKA66_06715 [Gemmatimonadales bacterium]|nr:hypothetical protein [Gemmatimonadales bacterium]